MSLLFKNRRSAESRLNFWPAYVDLMVVLALLALLIFAITEQKQANVDRYKEDAEKILKTLETKLQENRISLKRRGDSIILGDSILSFPTGDVTPKMNEDQKNIFVKVCSAIKESIDQVPKGKQSFEVVIEGHSDSVPISNRTFPSNWELSAARATNILRMMAEGTGLNYSDYKLKAIGYGDTKPIEVTSDSSEKNRRIEIKILPYYEGIQDYLKQESRGGSATN